MKQKNRIRIFPIALLGFLIMVASSCKKETNLIDYASIIEGTYSGTLTIPGTGTVSCSTKINKSSEKVVNLEITIGVTNVPFNGVDVSFGNNAYNLTYVDSSGSFVGKVNGNTLTWTLTAGSVIETFSGTKL